MACVSNGHVISAATFAWLRPIGAIAARKRRAFERRKGRHTAQCLSCAKFISRPSSICGQCGNDPVVWNAALTDSPYDPARISYDRAYGWEGF